MNEFNLDEDEVQEAIEVIRSERTASVALLQRRMRIGWAKGNALIAEIEERGFIGPPHNNGEPREVLI